MPRLFVAIDLPDEHSARLAGLRQDDLHARWTPEEQLHLTLRFIGEVEEDRVPDLEDALAQVRVPLFALQGHGLGVFPSLRRPRIVFAGIDHEPALLRLQTEIERGLRGMGVEADPKPFHPHVTLARLKGAKPQAVRAYLRTHQAFTLTPFDATHFYLYESVLRREGALHMRRRGYPLRAGHS